MNDQPLQAITSNESVTISVVIRDGRGFTHFYEDFVTPPGDARQALEALAAAQEALARPGADATNLSPLRTEASPLTTYA